MKKITYRHYVYHLIRLWLTKKFGSNVPRRINPETGEDDPSGVWIESDKDAAARELYYCIHEKGFLRDQIWWTLATPEEAEQRILMEAADEYMRRNT